MNLTNKSFLTGCGESSTLTLIISLLQDKEFAICNRTFLCSSTILIESFDYDANLKNLKLVLLVTGNVKRTFEENVLFFVPLKK